MKKLTNKKIILATVFLAVLFLSIAVVQDIREKQAYVLAIEEQLRLDSEFKAWEIKAGQEFDDCVAKGGEYIEGADMTVYKCFDGRTYYDSTQEWVDGEKYYNEIGKYL